MQISGERGHSRQREKSVEGPSGGSMPGVFKKQQEDQCGLDGTDPIEFCDFTLNKTAESYCRV